MEKEQEKLIKAVNAELEEWLLSVQRLTMRQNNERANH